VRAVKLSAAVALVAGLAYWLRFSPLAVTEHRILSGEIVAEVMGTGTLEARVKSTISPEIAGRIESLLVDEGDRVEAGQPLLTLDDSDLAQQVEIAEANIASAQAAITRLKADREQASVVVEQARRDHERSRRLVSSNAMSEQESEKATEAFRVAEAGMARAEAALIEGEKQLIAAEKNLDYRQALLADARVSAPFDGLIIKRHRDPGDIVVPGSPTLTLVSLDEIWVSAWVDETEMARLRVGQPARVVFRSEPDRSFEGQVSRLGREADRETREFVVDVRVLALPQNWAIGQRAEVYVEVARKSSVSVLPARYVVWRGAESGVFRKHDDRAQWQPVRLGLEARESAEVVAGLRPGDIVLTAAGGHALVDGRRVAAP
jgi:RND family efflux transporter MFP subunit